MQGLNELIVRIVHLGHLSLGVAEQRVTLVGFLCWGRMKVGIHPCHAHPLASAAGMWQHRRVTWPGGIHPH